jgi:hypothetical protein
MKTGFFRKFSVGVVLAILSLGTVSHAGVMLVTAGIGTLAGAKNTSSWVLGAGIGTLVGGALTYHVAEGVFKREVKWAGEYLWIVVLDGEGGAEVESLVRAYRALIPVIDSEEFFEDLAALTRLSAPAGTASGREFLLPREAVVALFAPYQDLFQADQLEGLVSLLTTASR